MSKKEDLKRISVMGQEVCFTDDMAYIKDRSLGVIYGAESGTETKFLVTEPTGFTVRELRSIIEQMQMFQNNIEIERNADMGSILGDDNA
jgi:hypothetical protein